MLNMRTDVSLRAAVVGLGVTGLASVAGAQCDPSTLFGPPLSFPANAISAISIVAADFNGDGFLDVATESNTGVGFVSVLLGDGLGFFGPATQVPVNLQRPYGLSTGDVNGDGFADIASGDSESVNVAIVLGNGDGSFQAPITLPLGVYGSTYTALRDMNEDGMLDLLVSKPDNDRLWYLPGNGDGTFGAGTVIPAGDEPYFFSVADVDGDGHLDLVVGNQISDDLSIIRGDGAGHFFAQVRKPVVNAPERPAIADVNGDGLMDIVVGNFNADSVSVLIGQGGTSFAPQVAYAVGDGPRPVKIRDFNGDGAPDVIVTNYNSDDVSLLAGLGDGTFATQVRFATNGRPMEGIAEDFNGDGVPDFIVVHQASRDITPLINTCDTHTVITSQPGDQIVTVGTGPVTLSVQAGSTGSLSYQWLKDGAELSNGGRIGGTHTDTLSINPVLAQDSGLYQVRVTGNDTLLSREASLGVIVPCIADLNADGVLNFFDVQAYLSAFGGNCP